MHTGQTTASRRCRRTGLLHPHRNFDPGRDGRSAWRYAADGSVALASPPKLTSRVRRLGPTCSSVRCPRTSPSCERGRVTGTETSCFARLHATSTRCARWPAGLPLPRSRSWSSPATSTRTRCTCPASTSIALSRCAQAQAVDKGIERLTTRAPTRRPGWGVTMALTRNQMAARAAQELTRLGLRQPRHRPAHLGPELIGRACRDDSCTPRTASSGPARTFTTATKMRIFINAGKETVTSVRPGEPASSTPAPASA